MTGRPFSPGYLPVVDGTRTNNILSTRLPVEYQSFREDVGAIRFRGFVIAT